MKRFVNWKTAVWLAVFALVLWVWRPFSPTTAEWDQRIQAMCAERWAPNKAYKVYVTEKIVPPKGYFSSDMKHFNGPRSANEVTRRDVSENPLIDRAIELEVLREQNPRVSVRAIQWVRQSDGKVVAEFYQVTRAGTADLVEVGYLNRRSCPSDSSSNLMTLEVFEGVRPEQLGMTADSPGAHAQ